MTSGKTPAAPSTPPASADLVFGRYQIIRRLAVGGMGEVFLARQSGVAGFDRLVILKSLLPDLAAQDDFVQQFLDEARVAATLNHPNIVSIYEVGLWNGTYFIAMEYIRGDNLSRLQRVAERSRKQIPMNVAAFIIHDAAHALDHAHKATDLEGRPLAIVHRDVSPQNIMVRTDGVTKVVDFGIAKAANRSSRTATGLLKGKVQYMAPEQIGGQEVDGRADQFALGIVLWELVAGRKLFQGNNDVDVLRQVLTSPIPRLVDTVPETPPFLSLCVERMLAKDRNQRYPSLAEAAADLKKVLEVGGIKNAQEETAHFVADLLGEEISAKTVNLTPSGLNNFVIPLGSIPAGGQPATSPTSQSVRLPQRRVAATAIAAGVGLSIALAGASAAVILWPEEPAPEPTLLVAPVAPLVPAAPPRLKVVTAGDVEASVIVDGEAKGTTPLLLENLRADVPIKIGLEARGYERAEFEVTLKAGELREIEKALQEAPTAGRFLKEARRAKRLTASDPSLLALARGEEVVWADKALAIDVGVVQAITFQKRQDLSIASWTPTVPLGDGVLLVAVEPGKLATARPRPRSFEGDLLVELSVARAIAGQKKLGAELVGKLGKSKDKGLLPLQLSALRLYDTTSGADVFRWPGTPQPRVPTPRPPPERVVVEVPTKVEGPGLLTLDTKPWAKLYIDGKYVDSTPVSKVELSAGLHLIRLVNEAAGVDETRRITIKPGQTFKQSWALKAAQ